MLAGGTPGTEPGPVDQNGAATAAVQVYSTQKGFVSSALSLTTPREGHTATLLPDGTVLFAGGMSSGNSLSSAEVYEAVGLVSVPSPTPLHIPRRDHRATLLPNGRVLLTGGVDQTLHVISTTETFDPSTGSFTLGEMLVARFRHSATMLVTGQVLLAGGDGGVSAELYDPVTGTSVSTGQLTTSRIGHTATLLPDGRVLIAGGVRTPTAPDAEIYDPVKGAFQPLLPNAGINVKDAATATLLRDGRVLLLGASSATLYQPSLGTFYPPHDKTRSLSRGSFSATLVPDGRVVVAGGSVAGIGGYPAKAVAQDVGVVEIFDPVFGRFTFGAPMAGGPRTATLLMSGRVLFAGYAAGAQLYDPLSNQFDDVGTLAGPASQIGETATLLPSGDVFLAGGVTENGNFVPFATLWHVFPSPTEAGTTQAPFAPKLETGPVAAVVGQALTLKGQGLSGMSSATGDGSNASPTSFPVAVWLATEGGAPEYGRLAPWSANHATWIPPASPFRGLGLLFVVTNGVPSNGVPILLRADPPPTPCDTKNDCASSVCADGVCCDRPCTRCEACSTLVKGQGADGICGPIAVGHDPHGVCMSPFVCDGIGHCAVAACDGGPTLDLQDGTHEDCTPYRCSTATNRCLETCASNLDCVPDRSCTADGHCGPRIEQDDLPGCSIPMGKEPLPDLRRAFVVAILVLAFRRRTRRRRDHDGSGDLGA
jgi:hypothetical protein